MADYSDAFRAIRRKNDVQVVVSRLIRTEEATSVANARLHEHMYDATTISIANIPELELWRPDTIERCGLSVVELFGERREVTLNLGTQKSSSGEYVNEAIFYDDSMTYDSESDRYEITVYIPAKCRNGLAIEGFDDSIVIFEIVEPYRGPDHKRVSVVGQYLTTLPPVIVQGKAEKKTPSAEDPVFPSSADRCDIGAGTIPSYYENSQGYDRDYLFTNSDPVYRVLTSGIVPEAMRDEVQFANVSGYLYDDKTRSSCSVPTSVLSMTSNVSIPVMTELDLQPTTLSGAFDLTIWESELRNDWAKSNNLTVKNTMTVSASIERV